MPSKKETTIDVVEFNTGRIDFCLLGRTPIILNRMSEKAKHELLFPKGRKTTAERAQSLKHNPYEEFRNAPYINPDEDGPTLLCHLATSVKAAMRGAGVDVPGATKAQIGRLLWVEGEKIALYGVPRLFMSVTRSADINRTPDVRTRVIVPHWACRVSISFMKPVLNEKSIGSLLAAAGLTQGVGDWRPEKGSGNYGQFTMVTEGDESYQQIIANGGRKAQQEAMDNPVPYDQETEDLLAWFSSEADRRGLEVVA